MTSRSQRGRTRRVFVQRHSADGDRRRPDELIVEEPLSIQLDGTLVATTMRTPGHDYELAVGFLHAEGMLGGAKVTSVRYCADGSAVESQFNVVTVETGGKAPTPTPRLGSTSSSCGLCGADAIDELTDRLLPLAGDPFDPLLLADIADRVRERQELFDKTGAVHAAASFDRDGTILEVREDIGRHNAVDKIVGRMVIDGAMPTPHLGLYVSGRASFEMVQKAWAGGFGTVVSVSAPSALAVETAHAGNLQLAGFIRDGEINVY
ncbi:MAG: FdhD protein [Verrucomicrobiales bacterium]